MNVTGNDSGDEEIDSNERETEPSSTMAPSLSLDEILGLLSDRHRRELLYFFVEESVDVARIDAVLDHLKKHEEDRHGLRPDRNDLQLSLLHVHLPKLADAGLIEYDERSRELRYHHQSDIDEWLRLTRQHEP